MRRVMGGIGVRTATELYDLLIEERLVRPSKARKVFRWVSGESAPNNKATVMLLERAGFLNWGLSPPFGS